MSTLLATLIADGIAIGWGALLVIAVIIVIWLILRHR